MAESVFAEGDAEEASQLANEALELALLAKTSPHISLLQLNGAAYRIALGDFEGASKAARESMRLARQVREELYIASTLQHLALLAALGGETRTAAQLLGYVDARYIKLGTKPDGTEKWGYDKLLAALHESLDDVEIKKLAAEGALWSEDRAVEEALRLE
jgi:hypothetical protein